MTQQTAVDLNHNQTQCLRESEYFTKTVVYNICNGTRTEVPRGHADYFVMGFVVMAVLVMMALMIAFIRDVLRD